MTVAKGTFPGIACWLRRLALAVASLAGTVWLLILLDIVACDAIAGYVCVSQENLILLGIVTASLLSVLAAWRWAGLGGLALVVWGVAFAAFAFFTGGPRPGNSVLISGVPFFIAGLLLLGSWYLQPAAPDQPPVAPLGQL
jgi:hypothetical protein